MIGEGVACSSFWARARAGIFCCSTRAAEDALNTKTYAKRLIMKLISIASAAACASAFTAPISGVRTKAAEFQPRRTRASVALESTRKDPRTGKIYVGEPEPLEELADLVGGLLGGLGRVADGLLGPAPVPIPIPVEDEREQAPEQPPVGTDPYKYPGTY